MKIFRNILLFTFIFLCLFCSCSGGIEPGVSTPSQEKEKEKEKVEKDEKNPDEDEEDDENETEEDETEDNEETNKEKDNKIENTGGITKEIPSAPIFLYCKTVSEKEIVFGFSQPVTMVSLDLDIEFEYKKPERGKTITVSLEESLVSGKVLTADFMAEDAYGNKIEKQVLFSSTASPAPALQINELRTEYSKPRAEYIELKMLSDGNLEGLCVYAEGNKPSKIYEFNAVEVKEGEYVVLHLRTFEESCKDEYGASLNESGGTDSSPTARDFWIAGSTEHLRKTDAVYVLDQNDWVLDAVMISKESLPQWGNANFREAAELLFRQGAWKSPVGDVCTPADAVDTSVYKGAATLSISRYEASENTHTAADWYVTKSGGATPGQPNKL
jgi:hypothetical protein